MLIPDGKDVKVRLVQQLKVPFAIVVSPDGSSVKARLVQPLKA